MRQFLIDIMVGFLILLYYAVVILIICAIAFALIFSFTTPYLYVPVMFVIVCWWIGSYSRRDYYE